MGCRSSAPNLPSRESARVLSDARAGRRRLQGRRSGTAPKLIEKPGLCLLHAARGFGVAERGGDVLEGVDAESLAQVPSRLVERQQGFERRLIALVTYTLAPFLVDLHVRLSTGAMIVQVGIQKLPIEAVDAVCVAGIDVSIADVFADNRAVLGLHQAVVAALPRPALGLFDAQFIEQLGDRFVDELRAVVGVEAEDAKRKLTQHVL